TSTRFRLNGPYATSSGPFCISERWLRTSPKGITDVEATAHQVPTVRAGRTRRPDLARRRAGARAAVVQRGPARWQPGPDRADGRGAQAAHVRDAGAHRLQGDRGRVSVGVAD